MFACLTQDGAAVFQASFQALKEASSVHKACPFRELAFNGRQVGKARPASAQSMMRQGCLHARTHGAPACSGCA